MVRLSSWSVIKGYVTCCPLTLLSLISIISSIIVINIISIIVHQCVPLLTGLHYRSHFRILTELAFGRPLYGTSRLPRDGQPVYREAINI